MIGLTISQYNKKPNQTLVKFQNQSVSKYSPVNTMSSPKTPDSNLPDTSKTALGNGSDILGGSAFIKPIEQQVFQPMYSGVRQTGDRAYNTLNRLGEQTDILNETMNQRVANANQRINAQNNSIEQRVSLPGDNYVDGGLGGGNLGLAADQFNNARLIATIGRQRGFDDLAIQIAIMAGLDESRLRNLNYGDRDSLGIFQQRPSQGWGTPQQVTNPTYAVNKFFSALQGVNYKAMDPWAAAQAVQKSFDPTGSNYRRYYDQALKVFNALYPGGGKTNAAQFINQYNNRYIDYDGAYLNQCVDLYAYYTRDFAGGNPYPVGYAPEIFNKYDPKAYTRAGANIAGRMGYVAVFSPGYATPLGHVAIVVGDNGNGTLRVLHSNATAAGPRGNTVISNISKASLMGYLIPNRLVGA